MGGSLGEAELRVKIPSRIEHLVSAPDYAYVTGNGPAIWDSYAPKAALLMGPQLYLLKSADTLSPQRDLFRFAAVWSFLRV